MINYEIIINSMYTVDTPSESNYVVQVNYTYKGSNGEYSSEINNSLFYAVTEGNFTPYDQLTKEIVDGWVLSSLGEDGVLNYQECIADQIEMQINPPITPNEQPLPF